jgi:hypothetical protein
VNVLFTTPPARAGAQDSFSMSGAVPLHVAAWLQCDQPWWRIVYQPAARGRARWRTLRGGRIQSFVVAGMGHAADFVGWGRLWAARLSSSSNAGLCRASTSVSIMRPVRAHHAPQWFRMRCGSPSWFRTHCRVPQWLRRIQPSSYTSRQT